MALQGIKRADSWTLGKSKEIQKNIFTAWPDQYGIFHFKEVEDFKEEKLIMDKTDKSFEILEEIKTFLSSKDKYEKYQIPFKRGIVLYGPPGTGKTATVKMLSKLFSEKSNGVVIQNCVDSTEQWEIEPMVNELRRCDPAKPILLIFDDIKYVDQSLIAFMDGQGDSSNCVFLFTTNYFDQLPEPLKRPSRTDLHVEIRGMTDQAAAGYMLEKFEDKNFKDVKAEFRENGVGLTYAVLKEVMILNHIFGLTYAAALKRIKTSGCDFQVEESKTVRQNRSLNHKNRISELMKTAMKESEVD